ncbi:MAG: twitching motility protein PilT [Sphingopyxis sp. 65-8]|uniref:antitoxin n=1 Tax=uncultured Sphingomonas sp. TaxID=158754 RepID=UPI000960D268|nr:AbrB/MazE/SpoVT family DNA-binding domain-containing protein [Sphingomonas sp. SCN 67-18]OJW26199.1 MAG: twitching motility protein PilT [Sphingopyxis sp. 65-8]
MAEERVVRLFRNGRTQAVRIPKEFELPGEEVLIRKDGHRLIVEPISSPYILQILEKHGHVQEKIEDVKDRGPDFPVS